MCNDRPTTYQEDARKVCRHYREASTCCNTSQHVVQYLNNTRIYFPFVFLFVPRLHTHFFSIFHDTLSKPYLFLCNPFAFNLLTYSVVQSPS